MEVRVGMAVRVGGVSIDWCLLCYPIRSLPCYPNKSPPFHPTRSLSFHLDPGPATH